jgi:uncharacterized protein YjbI with pentapeptide repeats
MQLVSLHPLALAPLLWRTPEGLFLTVPVKATFQLKPDDVASLTSALPLFHDAFYEQNEGRSLYVASDAAPRKLRADVLLTGSAYAPPGQRVTHRWVRLAVGDAQTPAVDKRLQIVGERRRDPASGVASAPAPFARMPIRYELAFGGATHPENPIGMGADPADLRLPSILNPSNPQAAAGFGPISSAWPGRRGALAGWDPAKLSKPIQELPATMDWGYFNSAPADQQIPYLRGDEWILLEGLHPTAAQVRSRLPGVEARVLLQAPPITGAAGTEIELRCDTLWIDADALRCTLTWRGVLAIPEHAAPDLQRGRIIATLAASNAPVMWPGAEATKAPSRASPVGAETAPLPPGAVPQIPPVPFAVAEPEQARGRGMSRDDWTARASGEAPAKPPPDLRETRVFGGPLLSPEAPPGPKEPEARESSSPAAEARPSPVKAPAQIVETRDFNLLDVLRGARQEDAPFPLAPPQEPEEDIKKESSPEVPWEAIKKAFPAMAATIEAMGGAPIPTTTLPLPEPEPANLIGEELAGTSDAPPPARTTENVPIVNVTPFAAFTVPWQVRPPKDSLSIIVKGTFRVAPGEPAAIAPDQELPAGDTHFDDDPAASLRYPSDFAIFKPKADILLVGHAYRPKGTEAVSLVRLRFGDKLDRSIAAVGPRRWDELGAPTAPGTFDRIPLRFEHAFGGAGFDENPIGAGYGARAGDALPPLELPGRLIRSTSDAPPAAVFAPVPSQWPARMRKIGTYDERWKTTRWPFFPDDFDWSYFNAAPSEQQIAYPRGDESFELWAVHPELSVVRGRLPALRVRVFAQAAERAGGGFSEVPLRLDTVWFDADTLRLVLVWRSLLEVSDEDASEIASLFVVSEPQDEPMTIKDARARFFAAVAASEAAEQETAGDEGAANDTMGDADPSALEARISDALAEVRARRRVAEGAEPEEATEEVPEVDSPAEAPAAVEAPKGARDGVLELLRLGEPLAGLDLTGIDLSGVDLEGRDLGGAILNGANLRGARLDGASLVGAILAEANCDGTSFKGANLTQADLTRANLKAAQLDGAILELATAAGANCEGASFEGAQAPAASFAEAVLKAARFDRANLTGAEMMRSLIDGATFKGATLDDVKIYGASGTDVVMDGASLIDLRADDAQMRRGSFRGIKGAGSIWEGADLTGAVFDGSALREASFTRATLDGATLNGADIVDGRFRKARLRGARMLNANLMRAAFDGADLSGASLRGSNLYQAETWKARTANVELAGAFVAGTKLSK